MTLLKQSQEHKLKKALTALVNSAKRSVKENDLIDLFPLPRYFQVHFEYLLENTRDIQGKLDRFTQTPAAVEGKPDSFIALRVPY